MGMFLRRGAAPSLGPETVQITITLGSSYSATYAYVEIDGVKYTAAATVDVPIGTEIKATVSAGSSGIANVKLNGENVLLFSGTYTYVAERSTTITMSRTGSSSKTYAGVIAIVTG